MTYTVVKAIWVVHCLLDSDIVCFVLFVSCLFVSFHCLLFMSVLMRAFVTLLIKGNSLTYILTIVNLYERTFSLYESCFALTANRHPDA